MEGTGVSNALEIGRQGLEGSHLKMHHTSSGSQDECDLLRSLVSDNLSRRHLVVFHVTLAGGTTVTQSYSVYTDSTPL